MTLSRGPVNLCRWRSRMPTIRKIVDEADAWACLAAVRAAGGDLGRWARAHGVDGRSLIAWQKNLGRRRRGHRPTRFVELVPASRDAPIARYVLEVGGARLEFDDGCSSETVRRVLQVLRSC